MQFRNTPAGRVLIFIYGIAAYALFLVAITFAIGFTGNFIVPKSIDSGAQGSLATSLLINAGLLSLFVIQHTVMARPAFKERWTRIIPQPIERSTFVAVTSLLLLFIFKMWQPLTLEIWRVDQPVFQNLIWMLFFAGWLLVPYASILIDHLDLFGLRQVWQHLRGRGQQRTGFVVPWLYRIIRNPLMLGFIIAFWSTPVMTLGHLQFAAMTTGYIFFGVWIEERDLARTLGDDYRAYRKRTPMLIPAIGNSKAKRPVESDPVRRAFG